MKLLGEEIVAQLEKNPQMIMWDPATWDLDDVKEIKDVQKHDVNRCWSPPRASFAKWMINQGILKDGQFTPRGFDGSTRTGS